MNEAVKPILIVPVEPSGEQIRFIFPDKNIYLGAMDAELAWEVINLCDGENTVEGIVEMISRRHRGEYSEIQSDTVMYLRGLIHDLIEIEAIADKIEVCQYLQDTEAENEALRLEKTLVDEENGPVTAVWRADIHYDNNFEKKYYQYVSSSKSGEFGTGISTDVEKAKVKAIAEAYEREISAWEYADVHAAAKELDARFLDPRVMTPLAPEQMAGIREFNENIDIDWILGTGAHGERVYVPTDLVFYGSWHEKPPVAVTNSSGFAVYTDYEGAVERAVLELVERDLLMRYWFLKVPPKKLARELWPEKISSRADYWFERGHVVYVLDFSMYGVNCAHVVITGAGYPRFVSGASATLGDFREAAVKAFYEAESQLIYGLNFPNNREIQPREVRTVAEHELLYAQSDRYHKYVQYLFHGRTGNSYPRAEASIEELIRKFDVTIVNLDKYAKELVVVKALSPRLIPINFGFGREYYTHPTLDLGMLREAHMPHYFA